MSKKYNIDFLTVKLSEIQPNSWNINKTTNRQQEAIAESLNTYGQVLPVLCRRISDGTYEIIDGEHRYQELKAANKSMVNISLISDLNDQDAKKLSLILNETRGQADRKELGQYLADLREYFQDNILVGLPYDADELNKLIELNSVQDLDLDYGADIKEIKLDDDDTKSEAEHQCPKCGYVF